MDNRKPDWSRTVIPETLSGNYLAGFQSNREGKSLPIILSIQVPIRVLVATHHLVVIQDQHPIPQAEKCDRAKVGVIIELHTFSPTISRNVKMSEGVNQSARSLCHAERDTCIGVFPAEHSIRRPQEPTCQQQYSKAREHNCPSWFQKPHCMSLSNLPQVSKDVWVWLNGQGAKKRPAPSGGGLGNEPVTARLVGGEPAGMQAPYRSQSTHATPIVAESGKTLALVAPCSQDSPGVDAKAIPLVCIDTGEPARRYEICRI